MEAPCPPFLSEPLCDRLPRVRKINLCELKQDQEAGRPCKVGRSQHLTEHPANDQDPSCSRLSRGTRFTCTKLNSFQLRELAMDGSEVTASSDSMPRASTPTDRYISIRQTSSSTQRRLLLARTCQEENHDHCSQGWRPRTHVTNHQSTGEPQLCSRSAGRANVCHAHESH